MHFGNSQCVRCSALLGYLPSRDQLLMIPADQNPFNGSGAYLKTCANRDLIGCNWLSESSDEELCLSCRHTTKISDISDEINLVRWARLERAKRRLFYSIIKFRLPLENGPDGSSGLLRFNLLSDKIRPDGKTERIMTGHYNGRITINIAEADDAIREKNRTEMGEPYRTLIGHFRHEVGHYYWDKLISEQNVAEEFRAVFGDERRDYSKSLKTYYKNGPAANWQNSYVSAYASAHPWEDFAETWAHYFHMVGGLETAYAYRLDPQPLMANEPRLIQLEDPYHVLDVQQLIDHWIPLTVAMNAMNRSIGNHDYYPFVLAEVTLGKLKYIHDLIVANEVPFAA
ncbi:MAG: putative zinc-binding metallopeptidase [Rhodobacteraceae bacterium]|nr:putative zinc-binding metallopeptidase [Paracoccaceae bacterium]